MLVKFVVNLGSNDAEKLALDFRACQQGAELDVPGNTASWLVLKGIATVVPPKEIMAVPSSPEVMAVTEIISVATEPTTEAKSFRSSKKQTHSKDEE